MARRGRRNRDQRDTFDVASDPLSDLAAPAPWPVLSPIRSFQTMEVLRETEDRRLYHPERPRPALRSDGQRASVQRVQRPDVRQPVLAALGRSFAAPAQVAICARRKARREVIFATRKHRKGGGARRRRRNFWSDVRC